MLNAELKSMNSNLTYVSILSRCVRAGWRAVAMALSSSDWTFMQTGRGPGRGEDRFDVLHD